MQGANPGMTDTDKLMKEENEKDQSAQPDREESEDTQIGAQKDLESTTSPPLQVTGGPRINELPEQHVSILCYKQDGNELQLTEEPIGLLGEHNRYIESPLFSKFQHDKVYLVLRDQQTRRSLYEGRLIVAEPQYRIHYWLDENHQTRLGLSTNTPLPVELASPLPELPGRIPLSGQPGDVAVCFVIDGTMTEEQITLAQSFVLSTCDDLYKSGYPLRVNHILYGEYRNYPLSSQRHAFEVEGGELDVYPELYDRLMDLSASDTFANQDYCDALELGLFKAVRLKWDSPYRYLVVVGNSPPHPTPEEREAYQLLDYTCDEFEPSIEWRQELAALRESGVHIYSYLIGKAPRGAYEGFVKYVWGELDSTYQALTLRNLDSRWKRLADRFKRQWPIELVPSEEPQLPVLLEANQ